MTVILREDLWMISSLELSADQLALAFLKSAPPDIEWIGFEQRQYSHLLRKTICIPRRWASTLYGDIGIDGMLKKALVISRLYRHVANTLKKMPLKGIVLVDYAYFHLPLLKRLKTNFPKLKVIYLSPPKTWASRASRNKLLKKFVDTCVVFYAFEQNYFLKKQIPTALFRALNIHSKVPTQLVQKKDHETSIFIYPGSRRGELKKHLPVIGEALKVFEKKGKSFKVYMSVAPPLWANKDTLFPQNEKITYFRGVAYPLSARSIIWASSGTITGQLASLGLPMLVFYAISPFATLIISGLLGYFGLAALPNLALGKACFPELVSEKFTVCDLVSTHLKLLKKVEEDPKHFKRISHAWLESQSQGLTWEEGVLRLFHKGLLRG